MTRRLSSSFAVALGLVLPLLTGSASVAQTPPLAIVSDSGMITLAPNQKLRITAVNRDAAADVTVRFRRLFYSDGPCAGGVCGHTVASQVTSAAKILHPGEAASVAWEDDVDGLRGVVLASSPALRVLIEVLDENTNQIIAILIGL